MFSLDAYDYELPSELIAQQPVEQRDQSNLLILNRQNGSRVHSIFADLYRLLTPDDVLVVNDTQVVPGRLYGRKDSGGKVEVLIADFAGGSVTDPATGSFTCECLVKAAKRPRPGTRLHFSRDLSAEVLASRNGTHTIRFHSETDFENTIDRIGEVPLPPYIKRDQKKASLTDDRLAYQTVYASQRGAVAAPTAGLHFTEQLLEKIKFKGIRVVPITLHVGYGTFSPVRVSDIRSHKMHPERFHISGESADRINTARALKKRVIAVGTTCVRTLEYALHDNGQISPGSGRCDLFIYPGYRYKVVDAMITNFHLPKSTLLMLVSAFAGRENILKAYREAIRRKYRFYSYGDAMFIC
jgi:S-adenosylmethionine:tRNA ribosyltransferase-isomerase